MEELVCYSKAKLITQTIHDSNICDQNSACNVNTLKKKFDKSEYLLAYDIGISNKEKQEKLRKKLFSVNNFIPMNVWLSKGIREAVTTISENNHLIF